MMLIVNKAEKPSLAIKVNDDVIVLHKSFVAHLRNLV
jgi:hypothetical protein